MSETPTPRYIRIIVLVAVLGLAVVSLVAWQAQRIRCADRIEARADNRRMWEFLINLSPPEPDDPVGQAFVQELDLRLPYLECNRWGTPVEVKE